MQNDLLKKFYELELNLLKPEVRLSREELDRFLADEFVEFGSSGLVYDKESTLNRLMTTTDKIEYSISDFAVRELSDNLVQTTFKTKRTINETDKLNSLRSSLWIKINDKWQMLFH